jgi:hypothetical protein
MVSQWIVRLGLALAGVGSATSLGGCAVVPVYRRAALAHPAMQDPIWPLVQAANQHMLEVREASHGGMGTTGGGCGCN